MVIADQYKGSNFGQLFWRHQPIKSKVTLPHLTEFNVTVLYLYALCIPINDARYTRVYDAKYTCDVYRIVNEISCAIFREKAFVEMPFLGMTQISHC